MTKMAWILIMVLREGIVFPTITVPMETEQVCEAAAVKADHGLDVLEYACVRVME